MAVKHPAWAQGCAIYQVNVRQYTPQGTLAAFEPHLERIAGMMGGQGILWFMPIQPIGAEQRKGSMGSYYSIRDYTAVNPEFGSLADFRRVVARAQALGLRVILDWVANHTAWDHDWTQQHPEWYLKDAEGRIHSYVYCANPHDPQCVPEYWTDVVGLDWSQAALWDAMEAAMVWWMRETGLDGFRCDVAALVPIGFWERVRPRLDALAEHKGGVFMLAEAHEPIHHRAAFDATYDWDLLDQLRAIACGRSDAAALRGWWARRGELYGDADWRMTYTANHDSNSWHGSCAELFGHRVVVAAEGASAPCGTSALSPEQGRLRFQAMAVLAMLLPGLPLIYGGQEAYFEKRLAFFEKDPIDWRDCPLANFYGDLLALKARHPALRHEGVRSGFEWLDVGHDQVAAFRRISADGQAIDVAVNLSERPQALTWPGSSASMPAPHPVSRPALLAPFAWWVSA